MMMLRYAAMILLARCRQAMRCEVLISDAVIVAATGALWLLLLRCYTSERKMEAIALMQT